MDENEMRNRLEKIHRISGKWGDWIDWNEVDLINIQATLRVIEKESKLDE